MKTSNVNQHKTQKAVGVDLTSISGNMANNHSMNTNNLCIHSSNWIVTENDIEYHRKNTDPKDRN